MPASNIPPLPPGFTLDQPQIRGRRAAGNIDLHSRPVVRNPDGSISTVRSMSIGTDQGEVLIPTVSDDGRIMEENEAIDTYRRTGKHLGIFASPEEATAYAQSLHNDQAEEYGVPPLPPGFTLDGQRSQIAEVAPKTKASLRGFLSKYYFPLGAAETALSVGTGMISAPINEAVAGMADAMPGGRTGEDVLARPPVGTYQPRSRSGQDMMAGLGLAMTPINAAIDWGADTSNPDPAVRATGHFIKSAIGALPAFSIAGKVGRGTKAAEAARPRIEPYISETPELRARQYVAQRTSVNWDALPRAIQTQLTEIAKDARTLDNLDPAALQRQLTLESLPVPLQGTRGQITRDPVQLRNEGNVSATTAGRPIRDIYVSQNRGIIENLEILKGRTRGRADSAEQVGQSVQGAARAKLELQKREVSRLYKEAERLGELQAGVSPAPLIDVIKTSPDLTHLGWVQSWLKKMNAAADEGAPASRTALTLKEIEDLRQAAVARAMDGGTEGYYAGKVIRAIDEATEGAGGNAYKAARAARRAQALEFEEQGGVASLVENRSRTDRAVALEDTWRRTVVGGSIEDLRAVKRSLLTGGSPATRSAGMRAWRDLRAQTLQEISNQATRSVTRFEDGTPNVTPAAMERALKAIGPEKLEELFGAGTVRQLNQIMEATRITKTEPPTGFKGSPTAANIIALLEKGMSKVPFLGDTVTGAVRGAMNLRELGRAGREIAAAQETPIGNALRASQSAGKSARRAQTRNALIPQLGYVPPVGNALIDRER